MTRWCGVALVFALLAGATANALERAGSLTRTGSGSSAIQIQLTGEFSLFSFPVAVPSGADTCFELLGLLGGEADVESIARFDTGSQLFEECGFSAGSPSGTDFPIRNGEGYALRLKVTKVLPLAGLPACAPVDLTVTPIELSWVSDA